MATPASFLIQQFSDNLYRVSLPVPIIGFEGFIGAWVYDGDPLILVDVGPAVSAPDLLRAMSHLGLGEPELILLTHIHIDHAGGIGHITAAFPKAKVVCHPDGVDHLIDPQRLWQGSVQTLGDIARVYEPFIPTIRQQIIDNRHFSHPRIRTVETPGHAAHHVSYMIDDLLFAGEAGGVCLPIPDDSLYLRPATPPRFFLDTTLASIDRLIAVEPRQICYGHTAKREDAAKVLRLHRSQLLSWRDMILPFFQESEEMADALRACAEYLLANDPLIKGFPLLRAEIQQRERTFMANSIKGYWGYLKS